MDSDVQWSVEGAYIELIYASECHVKLPLLHLYFVPIGTLLVLRLWLERRRDEIGVAAQHEIGQKCFCNFLRWFFFVFFVHSKNWLLETVFGWYDNWKLWNGPGGVIGVCCRRFLCVWKSYAVSYVNSLSVIVNIWILNWMNCDHV